MRGGDLRDAVDCHGCHHDNMVPGQQEWECQVARLGDEYTSEEISTVDHLTVVNCVRLNMKLVPYMRDHLPLLLKSFLV